LVAGCAARSPVRTSIDCVASGTDAELALCIARRESGLRFPSGRSRAYLAATGRGQPAGTWEVSWSMSGRCGPRERELHAQRAFVDLERQVPLDVKREVSWCRTVRN
jgi:hypothetical protein